MNKNLKTLKDLNRKVHKNWHPKNKLGAFNDEKCTEDNCPITDFEGELKAEAVKELKMVDDPFEDIKMARALRLYDLGKTPAEIENALFGVRRYLIWKNNLIEEDLK